MNSPLLTARSLVAGYGDFQALFSVDFEIFPGEVVALIGANGAGKSTMLKAFVGLVPLREGSVNFDGNDVSRTPAHTLASKGLAMVPEGRRLFRGMSVEDNLRVAADRARRLPPGQSGWTLERLYDLFPILGERRGQSVEKLSGGQQQMVAIGRALMMQPKVLLCDEISLGLAPKVIGEIYAMLPVIRQTGTSILLVEQDVSLASRSSDRVCCMLEGRIALAGRSTDLTREMIAKAYFGVGHEVG